MSSSLSVIVPAYNAERTLEAATKSVLEQSYANIEVWIVDDGSSDGTLAIAEALARSDARVHILHQENKGAYTARLNALKRISSKWVSFVDADDTIDPYLFSTVIEFASKPFNMPVNSFLFSIGLKVLSSTFSPMLF